MGNADEPTTDGRSWSGAGTNQGDATDDAPESEEPARSEDDPIVLSDDDVESRTRTMSRTSRTPERRSQRSRVMTEPAATTRAESDEGASDAESAATSRPRRERAEKDRGLSQGGRGERARPRETGLDALPGGVRHGPTSSCNGHLHENVATAPTSSGNGQFPPEAAIRACCAATLPAVGGKVAVRSVTDAVSSCQKVRVAMAAG